MAVIQPAGFHVPEVGNKARWEGRVGELGSEVLLRCRDKRERETG